MTVVDVLERGLFAKFCALQSTRQTSRFTIGPLAIDEHPDSLFESELLIVVAGELFLERSGEAAHLHVAQFLECLFNQHVFLQL